MFSFEDLLQPMSTSEFLAGERLVQRGRIALFRPGLVSPPDVDRIRRKHPETHRVRWRGRDYGLSHSATFGWRHALRLPTRVLLPSVGRETTAPTLLSACLPA